MKLKRVQVGEHWITLQGEKEIISLTYYTSTVSLDIDGHAVWLYRNSPLRIEYLLNLALENYQKARALAQLLQHPNVGGVSETEELLSLWIRGEYKFFWRRLLKNLRRKLEMPTVTRTLKSLNLKLFKKELPRELKEELENLKLQCFFKEVTR